jgi:hypothetical protein
LSLDGKLAPAASPKPISRSATAIDRAAVIADLMVPIAASSLTTAVFGSIRFGRGRLYSRVLGRGTIMTAPSKAALRAELEAALANYRGSVKQCPAAPPPEAEFEALDDEDETDEEIVPGLR